MSGYRRRHGSRPLFFERLVQADHDPGHGERGPDSPEAGPTAGLLHDQQALRASIARELADLFNTRVPIAIDDLERRDRSTVDYGIPDLSAFPVGEDAAMARLARHLHDAIVAYEPRIKLPSVAIRPAAAPRAPLVAVVSGAIELHMMRTPVMFELPLEPAGAGDDGV